MNTPLVRVHLVHHVHTAPDGDEDAKLIGVYSSQEGARAAVARLGLQPGFRDRLAGFQVYPCDLDTDYAEEGLLSWTEMG